MEQMPTMEAVDSTVELTISASEVESLHSAAEEIGSLLYILDANGRLKTRLENIATQATMLAEWIIDEGGDGFAMNSYELAIYFNCLELSKDLVEKAPRHPDGAKGWLQNFCEAIDRHEIPENYREVAE